MSGAEFAMSFLSGIFGGGLAVKLLDWLQVIESFRAQQRTEFLKQQVAELYGPLFLLARENQQLTQLSNRLNEIYTKVYCDVKWSDDETTRANLNEETTATIEAGNRYTSKVIENAKTMRDIIRAKTWLAEADDYPHFESIIGDMTRLEMDFDDESKMRLPWRVTHELEKYFFTRGDVLHHLVTKYQDKRAELDHINRSKWASLKARFLRRIGFGNP